VTFVFKTLGRNGTEGSRVPLKSGLHLQRHFECSLVLQSALFRRQPKRLIDQGQLDPQVFRCFDGIHERLSIMFVQGISGALPQSGLSNAVPG
jgi:hypothetical protein